MTWIFCGTPNALKSFIVQKIRNAHKILHMNKTYKSEKLESY